MNEYHIWSHARALAGMLALAAIAGCGSDPATAGDPATSTPSNPTAVGSGTIAADAGALGSPASDAGGTAPADPSPTSPAPTDPAATDGGTATPTPATPTPTPTTPAPTTPAPSTGELYPLPTLPAEVAGIRWPTAPTIARTVEASTLEQANTAAAQAGTRVHVTGALAGMIEIRADDVEIEFAPGASAGSVLIGQALARVAIRGGHVDHIETQLPMIWDGGERFSPDLMTTDITVDGVTADSTDIAFLMRAGVRVAVVNSTSHAARYSLWFGDTGDFNSEDVIIAGNDFTSAGPEATLRLVHVVRSVTVDNRLENSGIGGFKHNYRTHGRSRLNYASGNLLVNSGMMLGTMDTDSIGAQWFVGNTIHHTTPSLLEIHLDTPSVTLRDNVIYSDVWDCLLCRDVPAGWVVENNRMLPYQPAPAR